MRKVSTDLNNILSLVACAEDYAFESSVLFDAFAEIIEKSLSLDEIAVFVSSFNAEDGYGDEDRAEIESRLSDFKQKYCTQ